MVQSTPPGELARQTQASDRGRRRTISEPMNGGNPGAIARKRLCQFRWAQGDEGATPVCGITNPGGPHPPRMGWNAALDVYAGLLPWMV